MGSHAHSCTTRGRDDKSSALSFAHVSFSPCHGHNMPINANSTTSPRSTLAATMSSRTNKRKRDIAETEAAPARTADADVDADAEAPPTYPAPYEASPSHHDAQQLADALKEHNEPQRTPSVGPEHQQPHAPAAPMAYSMTVPASTESKFLSQQAADTHDPAHDDIASPHDHHEQAAHEYAPPPEGDYHTAGSAPPEHPDGDLDEHGQPLTPKDIDGLDSKAADKHTSEDIARTRKDNHKQGTLS